MTGSPRPTLSVVIPVFNEEATVGTVLERVEAAAPGIDKEIVVSNDGSTDGTGAVLREAAEASRIVLHDAAKNRGKGAAIRAGLRLAQGQFILIQDADLEMDPNDYPLLLAPLLKGDAQVVYGSRFLNGGARGSLLSTLANRFLTATANFLYGTQLTDVETCYKAFSLDTIRSIRLTCDRFDFEPEVSGKLLRAGYQIEEVPISYHPRSRAEGKKVGWRDGLTAVWVLLRCRFEPQVSVTAPEEDR